IAVRASVASIRRSTRATAAAISSTARWRSSTRPWSVIAKSTRSRLPPLSPSRVCRWTRARRPSSQTSRTSTATTTAPAAAPIAIQPAVLLERLTPLEREDHRVGREVVVGVGLAGDRLDGDLDLRRGHQGGRGKVLERRRLRLTGVDEQNPLCGRNRVCLLDGERHLNLRHLHVPRVLDGDDESELRA